MALIARDCGCPVDPLVFGHVECDKASGLPKHYHWWMPVDGRVVCAECGKRAVLQVGGESVSRV